MDPTHKATGPYCFEKNSVHINLGNIYMLYIFFCLLTLCNKCGNEYTVFLNIWVQNTGMPHFTKLFLCEKLRANWNFLKFITGETKGILFVQLKWKFLLLKTYIFIFCVTTFSHLEAVLLDEQVEWKRPLITIGADDLKGSVYFDSSWGLEGSTDLCWSLWVPVRLVYHLPPV